MISLISKMDLLHMYQAYVEACVGDSDERNIIRPVSFDEWYERIFKPNRSELTSVVKFELAHERVSYDGPEEVEIPTDIVGDHGEILDSNTLCIMGYRYAQKKGKRLSRVIYEGKTIHLWTWEPCES